MAIKFDSNFDKKNKSTLTTVDNAENNSKKKFSFVLLLYWISLVGVIVMGLHAVAPIAVVFLFVLIGLFWVLAIICPTIFTLGIVWVSPGYRNFVDNTNDNMSALFGDNGAERFLHYIYQSYWYVLYIASPIILIGLVLAILDYNLKDDHDPIKKRRMIGFIVFASLFIIASVVAGIFAISAK